MTHKLLCFQGKSCSPHHSSLNLLHTTFCLSRHVHQKSGLDLMTPFLQNRETSAEVLPRKNSNNPQLR